MATSGTTYDGLDEIGFQAYDQPPADYVLVLYTNTANSLDQNTVTSDLTQPTATNGYAPITLDGSWTFTNGVIGYTHSTPTHPKFTATGTWSGTVTGAALTFGANSVLHFKDLDVPFVAAAGKTLTIDLTTVVV